MKNWDATKILEILDKCCESCTFPMLDNGYFYLAATRLTLHRSKQDWAMVIETFGFSPRAGIPECSIYTFASRLNKRELSSDFANREKCGNDLSSIPHDEFRVVYPIEEGNWQDQDDQELIAKGANDFILRSEQVEVPTIETYSSANIELEEHPRIKVFEFCRALAATRPEDVLATTDERRVCILPELKCILQLEEWHHPDVVNDTQRPSGSETFQQLANILVAGDVNLYQPTTKPNTHWSNWPEGGSL